MNSFWPALLLLVVVGLVVLRPGRLNPAWIAGAGGLAALAAGFASPQDLQAILAQSYDAALTLAALFLISESLDSNHFFDWAADKMTRLSDGSGRRLLFSLLLLTTLTSILLANDGAVLMLTPIFAALLKKLFPDRPAAWLPHLIATGFFADAMSAVLIPSNLTNIMLAQALKLNFLDSFLRLALPSLAAFMVGFAYFNWRYRQELATPLRRKQAPGPKPLRDHFAFKASWVAFALLLIGYTVGGFWHLPVSVIALPVALAMLLIVDSRKLRPISASIRAAPWSIMVYAFGMFVLVNAAVSTPALAWFVSRLQAYATTADPLQAAAGVGGLLSLAAAAVNNLPATLLGAFSLSALPRLNEVAPYAAILGVNIGAKLTPYGSLATLLWLDILARRGIKVSWWTYLRENLLPTFLVLGSAVLVLALLS